MKNLKVQFKLIIFIFILLNTSSIVLAKNLDKFSSSKNISNYFSGILSINDNQYSKSYTHLRTLNNLEDSHYNYAKYYQYSLIALNKFKNAANYSKKLEEKKIDNFESNLISVVYYLENEDFKKASFYVQKIINTYPTGTIQNLLSKSLNTWIVNQNTSDLDSTLSYIDTIPERFENIKKIQKTFAYCYFDSVKTDEMFKQLTATPGVNYSRYNFFHANYLISKKKEKKIKKIIEISLEKYPENLIINQLKDDLKKKKFTSEFSCKKSVDIIAEIFYIISNVLASQKSYITSNFYLSLAKYLNPNFVSYKALHAENLFLIQEYEEAKKIYSKIKKRGSVYSWYASTQIASILNKQSKKEESIKSLKKSFEEITTPRIYELFAYAEFLKNNEKYKESVKYYSKTLSLIDSKSFLYAQALEGRGVAFERTNQWNKAETDLLNSLNASPNDAYVINYLAYTWIEKGVNVQESLEMLRKANNLKPNDGYIIDSLGWALFKLRNYSAAKKYLELAIRLMPSDPVVNDHYADALWMNNQSLQARYYWNYVLKLKKTENKLKKKIEEKLILGLKN